MTDKETVHGKMVYKITLGRTDVQRAANGGLEIPREVVEQADEIVIEIGPKIEKREKDGYAELVELDPGENND